MSDTIFVQSISSAGGKPLVGTVITGSAFVQWEALADATGAHAASVRSYGSGNPLLVALAGQTGAHTSVVSVAGTIVASCIGQQTVTASCVGQQTMQGAAAHDAVVAGNPVLLGGIAASSGDFAAVASGDAVRLISDLYGKQIVHPHATPENWVSAVTSTISTSADQLLFAGISGVRYYLASVLVTAIGLNSIVDIKDSTGSLWRAAVSSASKVNMTIRPPIRATANNSIVAACQTSGASAIFVVSAFKAP